jgi:hypothetical protein
MDLSNSLKIPKNENNLNNTIGSDSVYYENINEDSNSSSINLPTNQTYANCSKRSKQSKQTSFSLTSPRSSNLRSSTSKDDIQQQASSAKDQTAHDSQFSLGAYIPEEDEDEEDQADAHVLECPILECDSIGNLDGESDRHFTYESCPKYFEIKQEECKERRGKLDELFEKYGQQIKNKCENKKQLRNRVI